MDLILQKSNLQTLEIDLTHCKLKNSDLIRILKSLSKEILPEENITNEI